MKLTQAIIFLIFNSIFTEPPRPSHTGSRGCGRAAAVADDRPRAPRGLPGGADQGGGRKLEETIKSELCEKYQNAIFLSNRTSLFSLLFTSDSDTKNRDKNLLNC